MQKTYLITGGTGFIGSAIIKRLALDKNNKIICMDSNIRGNTRRLKGYFKRIKFVKADIRNLKSLIKLSKNVDCLIHLAFINGTEYFYKYPEFVLDIGVKGILNIIEACKKNKIKELIIASSSEVYQNPKKIPTPENVPLSIPNVFNPRYSYAAGKILTEIIAINNAKLFKKLIIFRPHNVYGPDMGFEHVIPQFIIRLKKNIQKSHKGKIKFLIKGSGKETRAFNFIDDFVDGFMKILKKGKHLNIYNIGTTEKIKIKDLAFKLSKIFKKKIFLKKTSLAAGGTKIRIPNINKIKKLGFKYKFNLNKGLKKTIELQL